MVYPSALTFVGTNAYSGSSLEVENLDAQAIAQHATDARADALQQRDEADRKNRDAQITAQQAVAAQADAERVRPQVS